MRAPVVVPTLPGEGHNAWRDLKLYSHRAVMRTRTSAARHSPATSSPVMPGGMFARFLLLALALLVAPALAFAQASACSQLFAGGQPPALLNPRLGQRTMLLCNDAYAVLASGVTRGALWSAEHPTAASLDAARDTPREGQFHAEDRLPPGDQARLEDYRRSGFDRGHMAPSGDMPDAQSQQQTFSLANMVPQTPELNRGVWAGIEMAVRHLAQRRGELYVVTGRWCTRWMEGEITPALVRYATTRWQRTDFGRPVRSIRFRTATLMAASACWAAKPRARSRGPISAL